MIVHVAEAGEDRGRVVLQVRTARPSTVAIEAAIRLAQAFQSTIESIFVEDEQLFDLAAFPFVREVSVSGRNSRPLSTADVARDLELAARAARRRIEELARRGEIVLTCRVVRDEPLRALSIACAACGPWNIIALADPFVGGDTQALKRVLIEVAGATGLVLVGPNARRTTGPVVIAVEDAERLRPMLQTAERLAALDESEIVLLLIGTDHEQLIEIEAQVRLLAGAEWDEDRVRIHLAEIARGEPAVIAETLRRKKAGFVIGQFGGLLVPEHGDLRALAAALECPLLLVK